MQIAVVVGYALIYIALHPISDSHWQVRSGLRLACLLLMPYRYWPALLIAEAIPNASEVIPCLKDFGMAWVAVRCIPPIMLAMPIVWWCRSRLGMFPAQRLIDAKVLIACLMMVTVVTATQDFAALATVHWMPQYHGYKVTPNMAVGFFIGNYIAILGVVPAVRMTAFGIRSRGLRAQVLRIGESKLTYETVLVAMPVIGLLSFAVVMAASDDTKQIARMAMFVPVAWLTVKYGWRAAAVGGAMTVAATCLLLACKPDPEILEIQAFIALAVSCLLATGARISAQQSQEDRIRRGEMGARQLVKRNFQISEQRRRQTALALEHIAGSLHVSNSELIQQMRRMLPTLDSQGYFNQVQVTQRRVYALADSMYPLAWRERGLPAALNETVARALDEGGISYRCLITGRRISQMSSSLHAVAYRTVCEAVALLSSRWTCTRISVVLRGGETNGQRWLVIRAEGVYSESDVVTAFMRVNERQLIATKLGAAGMDVSQIRDYVDIFEGELHARADAFSERITIMLRDQTQNAEDIEETSEPLRLWVEVD